MNPELVLSLQTTLLVTAFLFTFTLHPELQRSFDRPAVWLRVWYERIKEVLCAPRPTSAKRFWEIDMTEFEP